MCYEFTYYVSTEGSEGISPAHVEMSRVEPLQEANVIKTLCLEEEKGKEVTKKEITAREQQI